MTVKGLGVIGPLPHEMVLDAKKARLDPQFPDNAESEFQGILLQQRIEFHKLKVPIHAYFSLLASLCMQILPLPPTTFFVCSINKKFLYIQHDPSRGARQFVGLSLFALDLGLGFVGQVFNLNPTC